MKAWWIVLACSAFVAGCGKDEGTMCAPFTELKLPAITRIDRCDGNDITGETTASAEAFAAAFTAAGYEMGRNNSEPTYTKDWMWFRRGPDTFRMSSKFEGSENRKHPFFYISRDAPRKWISETDFQLVQTLPAEREKLVTSLRAVADIFPAGGKAPKRCPPLAELDAAIKTSPTLLLNLDASEVATDKRRRFTRGPELFASAPSDYEPFEETVKRRAEIDAFRARRIIPVIRVTAFADPVVPDTNVLGTFTPGTAAFEIGVVDLIEKTVLCRSRAKAASSETIEATTTTYYRPDGSIDHVSTSADAHADLAKNMRAAAFKELAKMSPTFAP